MTVSSRHGKPNLDPRRSSHEEQVTHFARTRDPDSRARAIEAHLGLAARVARQYNHRGVEDDDLLQLASLALVKAVDRFSPERGCCFSTYAWPTIHGEIKRYFRDLSCALRVPRSLAALASKVAGERDRGILLEGVPPPDREVAKRLGEPLKKVHQALMVRTARQVLSLSQDSLENATTSRYHAASLKTLGTLDPELEHVEERHMVRQAVRELEQTERFVIWNRFYMDLSQDRVAARLGCSQMHLSRLERRALARMKCILEPFAAQLEGRSPGANGVSPAHGPQGVQERMEGPPRQEVDPR